MDRITVALKDGETMVVRRVEKSDAEQFLRNLDMIVGEDVYDVPMLSDVQQFEMTGDLEEDCLEAHN